MKALQNSKGGNKLEDEKIVSLYMERSENAIIETANKYGSFCRTIAFNILSNYTDAEECENDTYLAAWNTIPPTRPTKLSTFLGRLTRNIALDKYDYYTAQKRNSKFDLLLSELDDCISVPDNVEEEYEAGQVAKVISEFLRSRDYESRNVFLRRYWYADSISDISERFGMSESKVKSMLFRTRKKLKQYLKREGMII